MRGTFALGTPTEYGFALPRLRHALTRRYLAGSEAAVLDFGCGNGANTVLFAPEVARVVGVDVMLQHLEEARAYAAEHGLANVEYRCYDGAALPFPDASFDNVVTFEVLEHTTDDRAALTEIRRVLRPGGVLVLSVPNKWYLMETHGFNLPPRALPWNRVPLLSWLPTSIHERWALARIYSRRRIVSLLRSSGFDVLEHRYIMPPFDRIDQPAARAALRFVFHRLEATPLRCIGVAHFIAARRPA